MSDPFLDSIERMVENGDVPQRVTNRQLLAGLRIVYERQRKNDKRIGSLEKWQNRVNGAIALGASGIAITAVKLWVI